MRRFRVAFLIFLLSGAAFGSSSEDYICGEPVLRDCLNKNGSSQAKNKSSKNDREAGIDLSDPFADPHAQKLTPNGYYTPTNMQHILEVQLIRGYDMSDAPQKICKVRLINPEIIGLPAGTLATMHIQLVQSGRYSGFWQGSKIKLSILSFEVPRSYQHLQSQIIPSRFVGTMTGGGYGNYFKIPTGSILKLNAHF